MDTAATEPKSTATGDFSLPAWWQFGYYIGTEPKGRLTLTQAGRLSFVLDDGMVIFSAPAALTKTMHRSPKLYGNLSVVVGPRRYILQFYDATPTNALGGSVIDVYQKSSASAAQLLDMVHRIEVARQLPADNQPLTAVTTNPQLRSIKLMSAISLAIVVLFCLGLGVGAGVWAQHTGQSTDAIRPYLYLALIVTAPLLFWLVNTYNKHRLKKMSATPVAPNATDTLPAGTAPTAAISNTWLLVIVTIVILLAIFVPVAILAYVSRSR